MRYLFFFCLGIFLAALILTGVQVLIIFQHARLKSYDMKPFVRPHPGAGKRFLFMGDSTAVGTGALDNTQSVAGYFAQDFPEAQIDSDSYNGRKLDQLVSEFPVERQRLPYDLVVIQIGANDIMKFTPYHNIERDITAVIADAKKISRQVVILHSGNVGLAPVFIWPFNWIMTERSKVVRQIYMQKAQENGVIYVDLYTERNDDLFLKDIPKYYSLDHLHPSGEGYRWWYQRIRASLDRAGVIL